MSGYKLANGQDLSTIFLPRTSAAGAATGYTISDGRDLSDLYEPGSYTGLITGYKLQNTNDDIATVFRRNLSPLDLSGCCLWMDASDQSTVTVSSSKISKWNDKSVKQYTMNQTTSGNQPTYNTSSKLLNGLPTLTFTQSLKTHLYGDASANSFTIGINSYSLFAVCKHTANGGYVVAKSLYGVTRGRLLLGRDTSLFCMFIHDNNNQIPLITNSNNDYRILELIVNRVSQKDFAYENGIQIGTITYSSPDTTNYSNTYYQNQGYQPYTMLIGAYNNSSGGLPDTGYSNLYLDGDIAEIVAVANPFDMTDDRRKWIEGYLAGKWGLQSSLPTGHPYKSSAPTTLPP